tara:strand:+ start:387 stop:1265 length:879 start_codon:yes stop_codon:yes gene_type:complete
MDYGNQKRTGHAMTTEKMSSTPVRRSERPIPTHVFRLMDLPQELKDIVYHELWQKTPTIIIALASLQKLAKYNLGAKHYEARLQYGDSVAKTTRGLPRWLLISKTVLEEGLRQLHIHLSVMWLDQDRVSIFRAKTSSLIDIASVTRFGLEVTAQIVEHNQILPGPYFGCRRVEDLLPKLSPSLEVLTIAIICPVYSAIDQSNPWIVELPLSDKQLPHIKQMVARFELWVAVDHFSHNLLPALRAGLKTATDHWIKHHFGTDMKSEFRLEDSLWKSHDQDLETMVLEIKATRA